LLKIASDPAYDWTTDSLEASGVSNPNIGGLATACRPTAPSISRHAQSTLSAAERTMALGMER
jgi:hypothetical protein